MVTANGLSVVHGVEGGDLVDTHGRHFQSAGNLVHDANAAETVLTLAKVEQGHDSGLLVLRGVPAEDFLDELLILRVELERDVEVVFGGVAVLGRQSLDKYGEGPRRQLERTTKSASLRETEETVKERRGCCLAKTRRALLLLLKAMGASLDAIVCEDGGCELRQDALVDPSRQEFDSDPPP